MQSTSAGVTLERKKFGCKSENRYLTCPFGMGGRTVKLTFDAIFTAAGHFLYTHDACKLRLCAVADTGEQTDRSNSTISGIGHKQARSF